MKRLLIITALLLAGCYKPPSPPVQMTVLTSSKQIRLVDESGAQVGSIEFTDDATDEEVRLVIKRKRP